MRGKQVKKLGRERATGRHLLCAHREISARAGKNQQEGDPRLVAAEHAAEVGHEKSVGGNGDQGEERQLDERVVAAAVSCPR